MEKEEYILKFPLKQLALIKVANNLWNDVLSSIKNIAVDYKLIAYSWMKNWADEYVVKMKEKVPSLLLPDSLTEELMALILPIGSEIIRWKLHHQFLISSNTTDLIGQICWTSQGTVDYRETAERLIRQERVDTVSSYKLACLYCLDDSIRAIWGKLSEDDKACFYNKEDPGNFPKQEKLITFWTYYLKGHTEISKALYGYDGPDIGAFPCAFVYESTTGNKAAAEYFFQKLTREERKIYLLEIARTVALKRSCPILYCNPCDFPPENFSAVFCYLLSQMSESEQISLFKTDSIKVTTCFLDWPWQHLFMKLAGLMWPFLSVESYKSVLLTLTCNGGMAELNRKNLFKTFFLHSPSHLKNSVLDIRNPDCAKIFKSRRKKEYMEFILENLKLTVTEDSLTSDILESFLVYLIKLENWYAVELFIKESFLPDTDKKILKHAFKIYSRRFKNVISKDVLKKLFRFVDNANVCNKKMRKRIEGREAILPQKEFKKTKK